jgi:hypothetical protein
MDLRPVNKPPDNRDRRSQDEQIEALRQQITDLSDKLEPVIEVWVALSGVAKVLQWIGVAVKWVSIITVFALTVRGLSK